MMLALWEVIKSVTNLGLRPIRNDGWQCSHRASSVTNLGLRPIRNETVA